MKKSIIFLFAILSFSIAKAQNLIPEQVSLSYSGETILHPGFKIGANYELFYIEKNCEKKNGTNKLKEKQFFLSPQIGYFYHKNYQSSIYVAPEVFYKSKKSNGNFWSFGLSTGYMHAFLPKVYEISEGGDISQKNVGYNYFISGLSTSFGKDFSKTKSTPIELYFKPQLLYAVPNFQSGTLYFLFDIGLNINLNTASKS